MTERLFDPAPFSHPYRKARVERTPRTTAPPPEVVVIEFGRNGWALIVRPGKPAEVHAVTTDRHGQLVTFCGHENVGLMTAMDGTKAGACQRCLRHGATP